MGRGQDKNSRNRRKATPVELAKKAKARAQNRKEADSAACKSAYFKLFNISSINNANNIVEHDGNNNNSSSSSMIEEDEWSDCSTDNAVDNEDRSFIDEIHSDNNMNLTHLGFHFIVLPMINSVK
jgi:hypothetical protein